MPAETRRSRREEAASRPTPVLPPPGAWSGNEADNGTADDTMTITTGGNDARLFTGSIEALERSRHFTGPGQGRDRGARAGGRGARRGPIAGVSIEPISVDAWSTGSSRACWPPGRAGCA